MNCPTNGRNTDARTAPFIVEISTSVKSIAKINENDVQMVMPKNVQTICGDASMCISVKIYMW